MSDEGGREGGTKPVQSQNSVGKVTEGMVQERHVYSAWGTLGAVADGEARDGRQGSDREAEAFELYLVVVRNY